MFLNYFIVIGLLYFVCFGFLRVIKPLAFKVLLDSFQTVTLDSFVKAALVIVAVELVDAYVWAQSQLHLHLLWTQTIVCLKSAIYDKSTRLSVSSLQKFSAGELVAYLSTDAHRAASVLPQFHNIWAVPLAVVGSLFVLYALIGPATFAFGGVILLLSPITLFFQRKQEEYQRRNNELTDDRIALLTEVIQGVRVLKQFAWEKLFANRVQDLRQQQELFLQKEANLDTLLSWFWWLAPSLANSTCIGLYAYYSDLDLATICATMTIIGDIGRYGRLFPLSPGKPIGFLPVVISKILESKVAISRLTEYFDMPEKPSIPQCISTDTFDAPSAIRLQGDFAWAAGGPLALRNLNLRIKPGQLVAVIGKVGSGKTSLLHALLGEMSPASSANCCSIAGSVAYVSQEPFILNQTVVANVSFESPLRRAQALDALTVAQMQHDLTLLKDQENTMVGEKGVTLSGGQKQRLAIARAVYANADVYLFDDPYSATDVAVGKELHQRVVCGRLKNKTRVLVTHQLQYLPSADWILVMDQGEVVEQGTYEALRKNSEGWLAKLSTDPSALLADEEEPKPEINLRTSQSLRASSDATFAEFAREGSRLRYSGALDAEEAEEPLEDPSRPLTWRSYLDFMRYGAGLGVWIGLGALCVLIEALAYLNWFLPNWWASQPQLFTTRYFIITYTLLNSLGSVLALGRHFLATRLVMRICHRAHEGLLKSVLRGRVQWFDSTPVGKVLARFTFDLDSLDSDASWTTRESFNCVVGISMTLALIGLSIPATLIPLIPCVYLYWKLQNDSRNAMQYLDKLRSDAAGPTYSHIGQTSQGLVTIRAYDRCTGFIKQQDKLLYNELNADHAGDAYSVWRELSLRLIGVLQMALVILFARFFSKVAPILAWDASSLSPTALEDNPFRPDAASIEFIALSYAIGFGGFIAWTLEVLNVGRVVQHHFARLYEYIAQVPSEKYKPHDDRLFESVGISLAPTVPATWPTTGDISFHQVVLKYDSAATNALNYATFSIRSGEKVGIVGRTGAGKSSIVAALLRTQEITSGSIYIDGVASRDVKLRTLRRIFGVVPQTPVLFPGTLRTNLDPFNEASDDELWACLAKVQLASVVAALAEKLNAPISSGGSNWSAGEKQLICMARAIVRKDRLPAGKAFVLILDEATASCDNHSDATIQQAVRSEFRSNTVITIAHRLATIMDYDRILVMSDGQAAEFDSPSALLANGHSIFAKMVADANLGAPH